MPPKAQQQPPPSFSMHVSNGLYLDNNNVFHSGPLPDAPVYEVGGGLLSLSADTTNGVLTGTLAVLPLKDEPAWKGKLRSLGVDEAKLDLFGTAADLASGLVTVVGYAQAALKIAEMLGILKAGKSVEVLAQEILAKLGVVQDMVADAQGQAVKIQLESSSGEIGGLRDQAESSYKTLVNHGVVERRQIRKELLAKAEAVDIQARIILEDSRWELFNQSKQYHGSWSFMSDSEQVELTNPIWWGVPRQVPRQRLGDDGVTWVDAAYPPAHKLRFDYRAALPFALQSVVSYIAVLTMAEPEFRSTARGRESLEAIADRLHGILTRMRGAFVRSHYSAYDFQYAGAAGDVVAVDPDGPFGPQPASLAFVRPRFRWQVGALDLCAHTDSYFTQLGLPLVTPYSSAPLPSYKLGVLDFDWLPQAPAFVSIPSAFPPNDPHWEIMNAQACADEANRQSERDYVVMLQASGYFQLAQLEGMLRHLCTDPATSETVRGSVSRRRTKAGGAKAVPVAGYHGIMCGAADVAATGSLQEYICKATVTMGLQPPDRVDPVPTRFLLVALTAPADTGYAAVMSEVELVEGSATVTLPTAETFDWYVEKRLQVPTHVQLEQLAGRSQVAFLYDLQGQGAPARRWIEIGDTITGADTPDGELRNRLVEPVTVTCTLTRAETDLERTATVVVTTSPGLRNARNIYVAAEETLGSGTTLRTYFDVQLNTQITLLPSSFFERERDCLDRTTRVVDYIEHHYAESAPRLPPHVPVTRPMLAAHVTGLQAAVPELVQRAVTAMGLVSSGAAGS
jgi:hypothetical protein